MDEHLPPDPRAHDGTGPEPPPGGWLVVPDLPTGFDPELDDPDDLVDADLLAGLRGGLAAVPPLDELTRRRLVSRALDAAPAPAPASPAPAPPPSATRLRRTPWWQHPGLLAAAAAVVVVVGIGGVVAGGGGSDGNDDDVSAAGSLERSDDDGDTFAADAGGSDAASSEMATTDTTLASGDPPTTAGPDITASSPSPLDGVGFVGDVGPVDDLDELRDALASAAAGEVGTDDASTTTVTPPPPSSPSTTTPPTPGDTTPGDGACDPVVEGTWSLVARLDWRGEPADAWVAPERELVVVARDGCSVLDRGPLAG